MADFISIELGAGLTLLFGIFKWMLNSMKNELISQIDVLRENIEEHRHTTDDGRNALARLSEAAVRNADALVVVKEAIKELRESLNRTDNRMERHEQFHQGMKRMP